LRFSFVPGALLPWSGELGCLTLSDDNEPSPPSSLPRRRIDHSPASGPAVALCFLTWQLTLSFLDTRRPIYRVPFSFPSPVYEFSFVSVHHRNPFVLSRSSRIRPDEDRVGQPYLSFLCCPNRASFQVSHGPACAHASIDPLRCFSAPSLREIPFLLAIPLRW